MRNPTPSTWTRTLTVAVLLASAHPGFAAPQDNCAERCVKSDPAYLRYKKQADEGSISSTYCAAAALLDCALHNCELTDARRVEYTRLRDENIAKAAALNCNCAAPPARTLVGYAYYVEDFMSESRNVSYVVVTAPQAFTYAADDVWLFAPEEIQGKARTAVETFAHERGAPNFAFTSQTERVNTESQTSANTEVAGMLRAKFDVATQRPSPSASQKFVLLDPETGVVMQESTVPMAPRTPRRSGASSAAS